MTTHQIQPPLPLPCVMTEAAAANLIAQQFAVIPGHAMQAALGLQVPDPEQVGERNHNWQTFAGCWNRLLIDTYMGDNGRYRYRRYGRFEYTQHNGRLRLLPHQPYTQPSSINPLNGGIQRYFEPLEPTFVDSPVLDHLLRSMVSTYAAADGYRSDWYIRLHPYRITASTAQPGNPTPEGLHRDGVTYIASMLINRVNVSGGTTRLADNSGETLASLTLTDPMDMVLSDDESTLHDVTEIQPLEGHTPAYRDVLVIAFERMDAYD